VTTRLGVLTDVHLAPLPQPRRSWHNPYDYAGAAGRLDRALQVIAEEQVDAIALLGDLTEHGDPSSLESFLDRLGAPACPVHLVGGNHDCWRDPDGRFPAAVRERSELVRIPAVEGALVDGLRIAGVFVERRDGSIVAKDGLPTDAWGEEPVVILSHYSALSRADRLRAAGLAFSGDLANLAAVRDPLLGRTAPTIVLSGHLHVRDACSAGSVLQLHFAALIEHPFELAIVDVAAEDDGLAVHRRCRSLQAGAEVAVDPLLAPAEQGWAFDGRGWREADLAR
jgi:predicted phosphodiesterase